MFIKQAMIDGFGKWYDETIDFQVEGLTCIYGENESGKSTLYQFILFMLFGFPPRKRELFRPKTGAKMGGRLTIYDETIGEFTIKRYDAVKNGAAICHTYDGEVHDEQWLARTLNGLTYEIYQSIFAFAANDLAGLNEMKGADLGNVLLSIGLTGSKNIRKIEKQLDAQMAELFKPYGKKPVINEQLANLNEEFHALKKAEQEEAAYRETKEKRSKLETEQQQLKMVLQEKKQFLHACEKKLQAQTLIQQYHYYSEQLAAYPESILFPEEGINRLKAVKEQLLPLKSEQTVLRDNLQNYRDSKRQLREKQDDTYLYKRASELLENAKTYFDKTKEQARLQETIQQKEMELETRLEQLNIGITKNELETISLTFYTEDAWNKLANDTNQLKLEWEQYEQEKRIAVKQQEAITKEKTRKEAQVLSSGHLQDVTETIEKYQQQSTSDQTKKTKKWQTWKQKRENTASYMVTGSILIALITGIGLGFFTVEGALVVPIIVLLIGVGFRFGIKRSIQSMEEVLKPETGQLASDITEQAFNEAKQQLADHERHTAELATIHEQLKKNDAQRLTLSERKNTLDIKQEQLDRRIEQQYTMYPFLEEVELAYWIPLYHDLQRLLNLCNEIRQLKEQYADLQQKTVAFQQQISLFFQEQKWESTNKTMKQKVGHLEQLMKDYQQTNDRIEQYDSLIQEQTEQLETVNQHLSVYEQEREGLYEAAAVTTEEGFFQKAKKRDNKRHIQTKLTETRDQLSSFFPPEEWEKLRNETMDEQTLVAEREELRSTIDSHETQLDANRQEIADLNAEISRLETSDRYSELLHRFHMEQEQLQELAKKWSVLKTAKELLAETKQDYQGKYIVKVMDKTTTYFRSLTNQTYHDVLAPGDGACIKVVAADGIRYDVSELSKGTTDQLYVSLRLAISEAMMEEHRIPFIVDDAFVHFDALRTENVMKILGEMAKKQQIIVFTCKKDIKNFVCNGKVVCLEKTVRISS